MKNYLVYRALDIDFSDLLVEIILVQEYNFPIEADSDDVILMLHDVS